MANKSTAYKMQFNAEKYDRVEITVQKGAKQTIQDVAKQQGESTNGYIKKAVKSQIKADTGQDIDL